MPDQPMTPSLIRHLAAIPGPDLPEPEEQDQPSAEPVTAERETPAS